MTPTEVEILRARHKREQGLWAAVINQALDDAIFNHRRDARRAERVRARQWFIDGGKDFKEVCALAGMEADWIRANALKKIEAAGDEPTRKRITAVVNGETLTVAQITKRTGLSRMVIERRIKAGLTGEQLLAPSCNAPRYITHNGETRSLIEWSKITGIKDATIHHRLKSGWSIEEALTPGRRVPPAKMKPSAKQRFRFGGNLSGPKAKLHTFAGKSLTLAQWSAETGIPLNTLQVRLGRMGWTLEQALTTPIIDPSKRRSGAEGVVKAPKPPKPPKGPRGVTLDTKRYTFNGETLRLSEWADRTGMNFNTIWARHKRGWSIDRILTTPVQQKAA